MLKIEARVDLPQIADGAQKQAGAHQQDHRQRHLNDNQSTLTARMAARRSTISRLERTLQIDARTLECRRKTEHNPDCERDAKRKQEDREIHANALRTWKSLREFREYQPHSQCCDNQAK